MESLDKTVERSKLKRPAESVKTPLCEFLKLTEAKGMGSSLCLSLTTPDNFLIWAGIWNASKAKTINRRIGFNWIFIGSKIRIYHFF